MSRPLLSCAWCGGPTREMMTPHVNNKVCEREQRVGIVASFAGDEQAATTVTKKSTL